MKPKHLVLGMIIVIALIISVFNLFVEPPPPLESVAPSVQILESRLVGRKDGVKQWELLTKSVLQADDVVTLRDLEDITIFQDEDAYLKIDANWATWNRRKDLLFLYGPLVVEGEGDGADQFKLVSDELIWEGKGATLTSPGPATINWSGLLIQAGHMVLETETDLLYLREGVEIREGQFVFRVNQAVYNLSSDHLDFYGQVALELEERTEENGEQK